MLLLGGLLLCSVLTAITVIAVLGALGYRHRLGKAQEALAQALQRAEYAEGVVGRWEERACRPEEALRFCEQNPNVLVTFLVPSEVKYAAALSADARTGTTVEGESDSEEQWPDVIEENEPPEV